MSLYSVSIRRPVLAVVFSLVILLFGIVSFTYLGVREYPAVDPPIITVATNYRGANAEVIETQITEPLEESINGIAGIRSITSVSRDGRSTITVEFELGVDLEQAANDVRDRVSRAMANLPPDVDPPIVTKADADAQPIVFLNVKSDRRNLLELTRIAEELFKERLQTIPGVSEVDIWGEKRYAMRIWLDPHKLAAYGLSPLDVRDALQRENVELPAGRIEGGSVELSIRTLSRLQTPEEFNNLILKEEGGRLVRLRDVGHAELGPENERTVLKRDGIPMVGVVLRPQPGANYIAIADEFYRRLEQIKKELPADIELGIGFDVTEYIRDSIREVQQTIFLALGLVVLIIFLFLRDWRTTIIPVLVIPVSLIGAFFLMYLFGFSINVLTLLGIVLAIGLVVDDAIVVLENIYAKLEQGRPPVEAGIVGTREIFFAVIATTLALVAVFMPLLFLGGLTGRLFREFGMTLAGAVVISSFVALTLTPMLSTRLLRGHQGHSWFYYKTEPFFQRMAQGYRRSLEAFLRRRWLAFPILLVAGGLIVWFMESLPAELVPMEDRSNISLFASGPEGATFEYMDAYMDQLIRMIQEEVPEHEAIISVTSPGFGASSSVNSGFIRLILKDPEQRTRTQQEIADYLSQRVRDFPGARTFVSQPQSIGNRRGGLPVQYVLQAPNLEKLREVLPRFLEAAEKDPTFTFVDVDLKFNKPELRLQIDRARARQAGVSALDIAQTLQLALSEQRIGYFVMNGKQYQVIALLQRENRNDPLDLRTLYVRNARGELIPLDNLVSLSEESTPPQRYRFDRYVSATVSAALAPGKTIGDGIAAMDAIAERVLDETFSTALSGPSRDFAESSRSLLFVFLFALALVYLILAAQFESFRDPFVIMLTVPLALAGALLALWYFRQTLNIFSEIGMIMLIGLVTKNGILIVEFAKQRKAAGLPVLEAIKEGASARFRPILMTSISTILGILPIALALGAGSESRMPMGIAIIGGMVIGTLLTLYVIPAIYTYLTRETTRTPAAVDEPKLEATEA
ncbi:efflux RND transporter permease subunit [Rhodothermus marinus]|uniref:efflux RND transporter permease subunit n=1 Tax=Rhodothermus marinus TaxID=29549 RepID=UPI0012BA52E9|nr:efflux RND transporter permease subunit [Rhodothermus marinus]BBM69095.1 multidrug resistance protein [Rhodothermus marinus]BBM72088.1 multidrug resistance protein [Rhodothermus marinus]